MATQKQLLDYIEQNIIPKDFDNKRELKANNTNLKEHLKVLNRQYLIKQCSTKAMNKILSTQKYMDILYQAFDITPDEIEPYIYEFCSSAAIDNMVKKNQYLNNENIDSKELLEYLVGRIFIELIKFLWHKIFPNDKKEN